MPRGRCARRLQAALVGVVAFALCLASVPVMAREATVTGTVVDDEGDPLPGVTISLLTTEGKIAETLSDPEGRYSFTTPVNGNYQLETALYGFKKAVVIGTREAGQEACVKEMTVVSTGVPVEIERGWRPQIIDTHATQVGTSLSESDFRYLPGM